MSYDLREKQRRPQICGANFAAGSHGVMGGMTLTPSEIAIDFVLIVVMNFPDQ